MYLSLYCKGLRVRGSWRLNKDCNILTSPASPDIAVCRSHSPDAQPEAWELSFLLAFSTTSRLQPVLSPTHWLPHQVEITVMQFRGHSLPMYQSMSVLWAFTLYHFAYSISFDYWPLECVTSFQCITLEWHVWPGRRSIYNTYNTPFWPFV